MLGEVIHWQVAWPPIPQCIYALEHQVFVYSLWAVKIVICIPLYRFVCRELSTLIMQEGSQGAAQLRNVWDKEYV